MAVSAMKQLGPDTFELSDTHNITAVRSDSSGNYSSRRELDSGVNLLVITGPRDTSLSGFTKPLIPIVQRLQWLLIEEEDEQGNECLVHWPPA